MTETTKTVDGKDVTVTYSVTEEGSEAGEATEGDAADAEVKDGKTTTVAFEDNYTEQAEEKKTGILELTKTIKGDITQGSVLGKPLAIRSLHFERKCSLGLFLRNVTLDRLGQFKDTRLLLFLSRYIIAGVALGGVKG